MTRNTEQAKSWMMAITFAEAGEWETARQMTPVSRGDGLLAWLKNHFMAIAFAEEGLSDEALRLIEQGRSASSPALAGFLETCGLQGVRLTYAVLATDSGTV